jgi:hypothetical protein
MLEDGTYDVLVVDAEAMDHPVGSLRVEVTVLAGPHKGEVLAITAHGLSRDPLDLLAVPGTVTVVDGAPHLALEG